MDLQQATDIAQIGIAVAGVIASIAVAYFVYFGTRRMSQLEYERSIRDSWMAVDVAVLQHEEVLTIADTLFAPTLQADATPARRRKRWFGYMAMNPLASAYFGVQRGLVDPQTRRSLEATLGVILKDDDIYELSQSGTYEPEFTALCKSLRDAQHPDAPTDSGDGVQESALSGVR